MRKVMLSKMSMITKAIVAKASFKTKSAKALVALKVPISKTTNKPKTARPIMITIVPLTTERSVSKTVRDLSGMTGGLGFSPRMRPIARAAQNWVVGGELVSKSCSRLSAAGPKLISVSMTIDRSPHSGALSKLEEGRGSANLSAHLMLLQ